jgi:hypothetical protein
MEEMRMGTMIAPARRRARGLFAAVVTAAAAGALATGPLAAPASAIGTPAISVTRPCYVNAGSPAPITVIGSGWTPGDRIALATADGDLYGTAMAGSTGSFSQVINGAALTTIDPAQMTEKLLATDEGNPTTGTQSTGQTAGTSLRIANLAFKVSPSEAPFTKRVSFSFSGFDPGRQVYAHYLHKGLPVARQRFGRAGGACGLLRKKALQYPGGHPHFSSYTVQFDDSGHYSRRTAPRIVTNLQILTF